VPSSTRSADLANYPAKRVLELQKKSFAAMRVN
jgi:hypothetical protein